MFKSVVSRLLSSSSSSFSRSLSSSILRSSIIRSSIIRSPSSPLSPTPTLSSFSLLSPSSSLFSTPVRYFGAPVHNEEESKWTPEQRAEMEKQAEKYLSEPDADGDRNHFYTVLFGAVLFAAVYAAGKNINKARAYDGNEDEDEEKTMIEKILNFQFSKPDTSIVLPAEQPDMFGKKSRTVVLGLHDFLIHTDWTRMDGWRNQKRPHYDEFIDRLIKSGWEIVVFSEKPAQEIDLLLQELDPTHKLKYRLAYESLRSHGLFFSLVKDISRLNRDYRRVLVLDWNSDSYVEGSANLLKTKRFEGDIHDRDLLSLADLCEKIQKYNIYDIRDVVTKFKKEKNMQKLFEKEEEQERIMQNTRETSMINPLSSSSSTASNNKSSWLGGVISNTMKSGIRPGAAAVAKNNDS